MKAETKSKIQCKVRKIRNGVIEMIVPACIGGLIGTAIGGYAMGLYNSVQISNLTKRYNKTTSETNERFEKLEAQNQKLLEEAMDITEGKESV